MNEKIEMNEPSSQQPTIADLTDVTAASGWRLALPSLIVSLLAILVLYRETAMSMVAIWARSETFTHGFLVPPITLWLIWRIRKSFVHIVPRPSMWALLAFAGTGFVWLLSELATVNVLSQFALTTMLILAVPAILGLSLAWRIAFPLAFLYFSVPFGEFALPQLMEWTANYTVLGLRLSGIPVYREGLHFIIPSGSWSVIEACGGVRYIITSLTVGTLFAYLSYHTLKRRLIFIFAAFAVPIIANWMRAYLIVTIAHFSGNRFGVGEDHIIFGWIFFGIAMLAMFWIGSHWREDLLPQTCELSACPSAAIGANVPPIIMALLVSVLAGVWPLARWQIERNVPHQVVRIEPLDSIAGWQVAATMFTDWTPRFENPSAVEEATFRSEGRMVGLYLGYYRNQDYDSKMVSSVNVLLRSTDPAWAKTSVGSRTLEIDQQAIKVSTAELRSVGSTQLIVWKWYWVNGHLTASDYVAKAYTVFSRLTGRGDDSAVIIIYAPNEQVGGAEAALEAFIKAAGPKIENALDRTREIR